MSLRLSAWPVLLLMLSPEIAGAQTARPTAARTAVKALLVRCMHVPDASACRAALRQRLTAKERSLALTYLAEADSLTESRDDLLDRAVKLDPSNALARVLLGGTENLLKAAALRPDWKGLHRRAAAVFVATTTAQHEELIRLWRAALVEDPADADAHVALGRALVQAQRQSEADQSFRSALAIDANHVLAREGLCEVLLAQEGTSAAEDQCSLAIRQSKGQLGDALRTIGFLAYRRNLYSLALQACEEGLAAEPDSLSFRSACTGALVKMGRQPEAERRLHEYLARRPDDGEAMRELADLLYAQDRLGPAREWYLRAFVAPCARFAPACTDRGRLAVVSLRLGLVDDAFRYLEEALESQGDCPGVVTDFTSASQQRSDASDLSTRLRQSLDAVGSTIVKAGPPKRAAEFFASIGDWTQAARYYEMAIGQVNGELERGFLYALRYDYGRALVHLGRHCDALREFTAAQAEVPAALGKTGWLDLTRALEEAKVRCREEKR